MTTQQAITLLYAVLFFVVAPVTVYTAIAAYLVQRSSWWLLAIANAGMTITLAALIIQRSTLSDPGAKALMTIVQRFGIVAWIVGSAWLTIHLMWLENGRLAAVRDAMTLAPVRKYLRKLWRKNSDATGTVEGDRSTGNV